MSELSRGSYLGRALRLVLRVTWPFTVLLLAGALGFAVATLVATLVYACVLLWRVILGG
jgi:hypothetical protein